MKTSDYWTQVFLKRRVSNEDIKNLLDLARKYSLETPYSEDTILNIIDQLLEYDFEVPFIIEKTIWLIHHSIKMNQPGSLGQMLRCVIPDPPTMITTRCCNCLKPTPDYEPKFCCNGFQCGCYGLPIDPPLCEECEEQLIVVNQKRFK